MLIKSTKKIMERVGMVNDNLGSVYGLLHFIRKIPGSNICYKDTNGTILWSNEYFNKDLNQNVLKKTSFDLFYPETAKECIEYDQEVIGLNNTICKQQSIRLVTGEHREYFVTKTPWMPTKSGPIKGVIVNAINMRQTVCKQLKNCYSINYSPSQLRNLYFYLKQPLQEVLLLVNLMLSEKRNNDNPVSLCSEVKKIIMNLLSYCNFHLGNKSNNSAQIPLLFSGINLVFLVKEIFNKQII